MSTDKALQAHVVAELNWEPTVDAAHIGVVADGAVVTLSGHVASLAQKHAAVAAARRVKGVRVVADDIEVRLPADRKWHDDEIGKRAAAILGWAAPELLNRIRLTVSHGVVTLEGVVERYADRVQAEHLMRRLSGVVGVDDKLLVKSLIDPSGVKEQIEAAFRRGANLEAHNLSVTTKGPVVTLEGHVRSAYERDIAERAAWAAPGVTEIRNLIRIDV